MTNVERLHARFDRAIPPRLLMAAQALDRAEARRPRLHCRIGPIDWKPAGIIERMARKLVDLTARKGAATRMDLKAAGFTSEQVDLYGARAIARAREIAAEKEAA